VSRIQAMTIGLQRQQRLPRAADYRQPAADGRAAIGWKFREPDRLPRPPANSRSIARGARKQGSLQHCRALPRAPIEREPMRIRSQFPTTRAEEDHPSPTPAFSPSRFAQPGAERLQRSPRTSPSLPPLLEQYGQNRRAAFRRWRPRRQKAFRQRGSRRPHDAFPDQTHEPAVFEHRRCVADRLKPGDRPPTINDQNRGPASQAINERTQSILGFGYTSFLHMAIIAFLIQAINRPSSTAPG